MKKLWNRGAPFLIIAGALLLRLIYLVEIRKSPFFFAPFGDGQYFDTWAMSIVSGNIAGSDVFFKAPLYPYVLAFFYWLFGHHLLIPRFLNLLFDAASVMLIFSIARKLWNRTVGLIAAGLLACGGIFIYFSGEILGTSLALMLGLALLNMLIYQGKRFVRWFFAGVVLSLLVLVRPNGLLLLPGTMLFLLLMRGPVRAKVFCSLWFLMGMLPLIAACGVRNYVVGKDLVLVNYSGGVNFYIGNNEESDGVSAVLPGYGNDWDEYAVAEVQVGRALQPSEVSRYWMIKGLRFIGSHPFRASLLMLKKCYLLFNGKEISNNQNIYRFAGNSFLLKGLLFIHGGRFLYFAFPSSVLIALAISGVLLSVRSQRPAHLLSIFLILFGLSVVLFFVSARYRMVFIAYLVPFAAFSLHSLADRIRRRRNVGIWFAFFLPCLFLCNMDPYLISMENEALECYNLGNAYFRKGELEKARMHYERGIAENPQFPRIHLNLGAVYFKKGRYEEAEKAYLQEIAVNPLDGRAYHNLSLLYGQRGRLPDAVLYAQDAVRRSPRFAEAQRNLGRLYIKIERFDSAIVHLETAYGLRMRDARTLAMLGLAHLKSRSFDRAIHFYLEALQLEKDDPLLEYNCGVAYLGKGELDHAKQHLLRAVMLQDDFAEAHFNLGMVYLRQEDGENARKHLARTLELKPDLIEAKKMIEKLP